MVSVLEYSLMPMTAYYIWLLLGMLLLRYQPLLVLSLVTGTAAVAAVLLDPPTNEARLTAIVTLLISLALILFASSRQQSGLPGPVSEAMLTDLRDLLQSQGRIPALPEGWRSQSAMLAANNVGYGGDFLVARIHRDNAQGPPRPCRNGAGYSCARRIRRGCPAGDREPRAGFALLIEPSATCTLDGTHWGRAALCLTSRL